jgi:hypothetical protein
MVLILVNLALLNGYGDEACLLSSVKVLLLYLSVVDPIVFEC